MKLNPTNPSWQVRQLARHDLSMAEGQARANAARSWASVYERASGIIRVEADKVTEASQNSEVQKLYNQGMEQINTLENTLYSEQQLPMNSPLMSNVNYDDSYSYVENGNTLVGNRGFASIHTIGNDVWKTQSMAIAKAFANQGSSDRVKSAVAAKLQQQLLPKTQSVGRHVLNLATADRRATVSGDIATAVRNGDLNGALALSNDGLNRGVFNQKEHADITLAARQQSDLMQYRQLLSVSDDEADLSNISENALFSNNWMTPAQKTSVSDSALRKLETIRAEQKSIRAEWMNRNEVSSVINFHDGAMTVTELLDSPHKYTRAGFTRLYDRMTNPTPTVSNPLILNDYQRQIIDMQFESGPDNSIDDISRGIMVDMGNSVKLGTLTPKDFEENRVLMEKQAQAPFKTQPYQQAKKSLFVDILGTMDPATMEEIQRAGVNINSMMLQAMGQKSNVAVLGIRAFEDLNQYMRTFGYQADPIKWWGDNKDAYKVKNYLQYSANKYLDEYPSDTVKLSNGQVDIKSTEDHLIRQYNLGAYGVTGSSESMKELNKRAETLKGVNYE